MFLDPDQIKTLTGFATKAKQIAQLRKMGIAFHINGRGCPVVTIAAVQGVPEQVVATAWQPAVLQGGGRSA